MSIRAMGLTRVHLVSVIVYDEHSHLHLLAVVTLCIGSFV
jgi:hypothetical protein